MFRIKSSDPAKNVQPRFLKEVPPVEINETPTATNQIYDFIGEYLGRTESTHVNRASAASRCYKQRWFQRNGYKGEDLTPRVIVNFTLGDLTEHTVKYFIMKGCVGPGKLYSEVDFGKLVGKFTIQNGKEIELHDQDDLTADLGGITVTAHVDGWGKRNSDGQWELIEVKSAADFGFEEFKTAGPGDYIKQALVNIRTNRGIQLGVNDVRFFYLKKNTGHLHDRLFSFDEALFQEVIEEYKLSNQTEMPRSPYVPKIEAFRGKPTGRKVLQWQCAYCPFKDNCFDLEVEMKGEKPVFVVKGTK